MSKKQYKEAFSNIHPSDESIERIMSMTNKKHFCAFPKALIILAVIISLFCSVGLVANAATDGAVAETISKAAKEASRKITVLVNGKEEEGELKITETTNDDGEKYYVAEVKVDTPDGGDSYAEYIYDDEADAENIRFSIRTYDENGKIERTIKTK